MCETGFETDLMEETEMEIDLIEEQKGYASEC